MTPRIVCLPGDGIGAEVMEAAYLLLDVLARSGVSVDISKHAIGQAAIDEFGEPLPARALEAARSADAVLMGAVGGRTGVWPESAVLGLRKELDVFANLRPVRAVKGLETPLRPEVVDGTDILFLREATGGAYFGEPKGPLKGQVRSAVDTTFYDEIQIARAARLAFKLAEGRKQLVTSVDKANVMATSRLWREVVDEISRDFSGVQLEHLLADAAAYQLVNQPRRFDVVLTENLFGDILSDEAGVIAGSLGLLGSASLGDSPPGLFEPVHGSAPDIAGKGVANPLGMARTVSLMLTYGLDMTEEGRLLDRAIDELIREGPLTRDLDPASNAGTMAVAEALSSRFETFLSETRP